MGEKVLGPATATIIIDNSIHFLMHSIFLTGTAGAGKSLLTSVITAGYADRGSDAIAVNLDPGARSLPYSPDVDVRSFIDLNEIMDKYQLGPNGSLIFASDLVATRIVEIEEEIASLSPDYVFFDTPGQIELFAYRSSGPYIVESIRSETKLNLFLFLPSPPPKSVEHQLSPSTHPLQCSREVHLSPKLLTSCRSGSSLY